jgi:integrin alpha FG-GAP repeat containing protein 1
VEILFGCREETMFRARHGFSCHFTNPITSVIPGDFNGDSYMDVMVTLAINNSYSRDVYINWGEFGDSQLSCADDSQPALIRMYGEPLALDYNGDMVLDLFGVEENQKIPTFWVFGGEKKIPKTKPLCQSNLLRCVTPNVPNAHAILDLNQDNLADLFVTTKDHYEIWNGIELANGRHFEFGYKINLTAKWIVGQAIFIDVELKGNLNLIVPICFDRSCKRSTIHVHSGAADGSFENLHVSFKDEKNQEWGFVPTEKGIKSDKNSIY